MYELMRLFFFAIGQLVTQAQPNSGTQQEGGGGPVRTNLNGGATQKVPAGNSIQNRHQFMTQERPNSGAQRGRGRAYDRIVHINFGSGVTQNVSPEILLRRSSRDKIPVAKFNVC